MVQAREAQRKPAGRSARYEHVVHYLRSYAGLGDRVLEVACGSAPYRDLFTPGRYLGTDVANPHYQAPGDVDVLCSADALPFCDACFDLIFSQSAIDYLPNLHAALAESFRALRPGGRLLVFSYSRATLERIHEASRHVTHGPTVHHTVFAEQEMVRWLRETGFIATRLPMRFPRTGHLAKRLLASLPLFRSIVQNRSQWRIFLATKPA